MRRISGTMFMAALVPAVLLSVLIGTFDGREPQLPQHGETTMGRKGKVMIWNGKVLFRKKHGSKIAIGKACCCVKGGPCECPTDCVDGYSISIVAPDLEQYITDRNEYCSHGVPDVYGAGYVSEIKALFVEGTYFNIRSTLTCALNEAGKVIWTLSQGTDEVGITIEGESCGSYYSYMTFEDGGCGADGLPEPGTYNNWQFHENNLTCEGFPLPVEITENPLP